MAALNSAAELTDLPPPSNVMPPSITALCHRSKRIIRAGGVLSKSKLPKNAVLRATEIYKAVNDGAYG